MKFNALLYFVVLLICGVTLQACTTDKYDFDKDITLGLSMAEEGLQVPGESDLDIPMSQIIELKDSSELMIDSLTGNYLFYKVKDNMDTTTVCIANGSLCDGTDDIFEMSLKNNPDAVITPNKRFPEFGSLEFLSVLTPSFNPDVLKTSIRELNYMKVSLDIEVSISFKSLKGISAFNEIRYEVPFFYVVDDESDLIETNVKTDGIHTHRIHISGVDFSRVSPYEGEKVGIEPLTRQLLLQGSLRIRGTAKTVNISDYESVAEPAISYHVMVGTLGTFAVTGRFDQQEKLTLDPIEFDNLPDFIKDEEVSLDLVNPKIEISVSNEVPTEISLNAVLMGMRDGREISRVKIGSDYGTQAIAFAGPDFDKGGAVKTNIWVSRRPIEEIPDSIAENVVIPEVMDIVRHMPDAIRIDAYAKTDSNRVATLSLLEKYKAVPKYEMIVPLKIGKDMKIVYNKDFEDLNKVLKHVDLHEIVIQAQAINHLPLNLSMKMEAYDSEGREIAGLTYGLPSEDDPIPGSLHGATSKDITIRIKNSGVENCLHQVDHLRLKIYALSSAALEGQYLNRNQNLQLRNIKLLLK